MTTQVGPASEEVPGGGTNAWKRVGLLPPSQARCYRPAPPLPPLVLASGAQAGLARAAAGSICAACHSAAPRSPVEALSSIPSCLALLPPAVCARAAYGAFRCWLEGRDIPKPDKHGWVAGLEEGLAAYLASLPYTLTVGAVLVCVVRVVYAYVFVCWGWCV